MPWPWLVLLSSFVLGGQVYRFYRTSFRHLPLHMDTAYYVTNHAVSARRYRPFRGWNAHFSGGSRLLPELVHSLLFLRLGGARYAAGFRELYTWLSWSTAVACGVTTLQLVPHGLSFWIGTVMCAALLAEVQYGAYFESAEVFENLFQTVGMALIVTGLAARDTALICIGVTLLWADFSLVKLTGALPALAVSVTLVWIDRSLLAAVLALGALHVLGYAVLVTFGGTRFSELLGYLRRHEAYVRRNYRNPLKLLAVKLGFAGVLALRNPVLPLLAASGVVGLASFVTAESAPLFIVYGAFTLGSAGAMLRQGNRVWYYMLPLIPPLAVLATSAIVWLDAQLGPAVAAIVAAGALAASVARNLWHVRGLSPLDASRRVFAVYNRPGGDFGEIFARTNVEVQSACEQLRSSVRGSTALVVGRYNQANVLLEAAYDTPIASVCELSEAVAGDLRHWLPDRPLAELPAFLIDTNDEFPARAAQLTWMQNYEFARQVGSVRLYERSDRRAA